MSEMTKLNLAYLQNLQNSDQGPLGFIYPQLLHGRSKMCYHGRKYFKL